MTDQTLPLAPTLEREPASTAAPPRDERRGLFNRRLKDRRGSVSRINAAAPRRSRLKLAACWAASATFTLFFLALIIGEVFYSRTLYMPLAVFGALVGLSLIAVMLGLIEERLIEIRLELMMLNGGGRRGDRASGVWDDADRRQSERRQSDRRQGG